MSDCEGRECKIEKGRYEKAGGWSTYESRECVVPCLCVGYEKIWVVMR